MTRPKVASILLTLDNGREIRLENKGDRIAALFFDRHGVEKILHGFYKAEGKSKEAKDVLAAWGEDATSKVVVIAKSPDCAYDPIP